MTRIRLVLMLYFFMVAHKAARQTLSKALSNGYVFDLERDEWTPPPPPPMLSDSAHPSSGQSPSVALKPTALPHSLK